MAKKIILGVTGGIAAYKSAELLRLLAKKGYDVTVAMTEAAAHFVSPLTFEALSGKKTLTGIWDDALSHIHMARADAILIAPATADFLAKLAAGQADDLLSAVCLARSCPLYVAPAMNVMMWENPATQRNVALLENDGVTFFGPDSGIQACGETGMGRMAEPETILELLENACSPKILSGKKVLITAGPTFEEIDPVRGITNSSSGKMGYSLAKAALDSGATVTLVSGPVSLKAPSGAELIPVKSAEQMLRAVMEHIEHIDLFLGVAAVSDYRVVDKSAQKIKKKEKLILELEQNPDILASVYGLKKPPYCVGFAAETENMEKNARKKLKKADMIVGNSANAIGCDENELVLFDKKGRTKLARAHKSVLARQLIEEIAKRL